MRVNATHTSYVAGIVSLDQRLVKFQLHPGSQDPGTGFGGQPWIPSGHRTGLLAAFNGGFRLNASHGGFYLNGAATGTLTKGAASVAYYRNGTIKIGQEGRDVTMTPQVAGMRQNFKLIVDHGKVALTSTTTLRRTSAPLAARRAYPRLLRRSLRQPKRPRRAARLPHRAALRPVILNPATGAVVPAGRPGKH